MASKYRKKFNLPEEFYPILEAYAREVLRDQPIDILEFSYLYFKAMEEVSSCNCDMLTDLCLSREPWKHLTIRRREHKYHRRSTEDLSGQSLYNKKDRKVVKMMKSTILRLVTTTVTKTKTMDKLTTMKTEKEWTTAKTKSRRR